MPKPPIAVAVAGAAAQVPAELRAALPSLPCSDDGPVFSAPWEAQAFAMTLALHQRGLFSWPEWAAELSRAIADAQAEGDPDTGEHYYRHWLRALERLAIARGAVDAEQLSVRRQQWDAAARATPHGRPIELPAATGRARTG